MEKSEPVAHSRKVSDPDRSSLLPTDIVASSSAWKPGYGERFPWIGFGSLAGVILCAVGSVAVLIGSDNVSATKWTQKLAPNVILSAINAISNILLIVAITSGIPIAWWRKTMRGATVAELHKSWAFSTSLRQIVVNLGSLDTIALAALATKLAVIDGVLFQRATTTYTAQDPPRAVSAIAVAATEFPSTGYIVSNNTFGAQANCGCFMIGDAYNDVVNNWETSNGFYRDFNDYIRVQNPKQQHCDGTCFTNIEAIGFEIDCSDNGPTHENIAAAPLAAYNASTDRNGPDKAAWTDVPIFNSSFALRYPDSAQDYTSILLNLYYFQSDDPYNPSDANCSGRIYNTTCELRPALVTYPVKVMNFSNPHIINGVSLESASNTSNTMVATQAPAYSRANKQADGFKVGDYLQVSDTHKIGGLTALGGLVNALSQFMSSSATISYSGDAEALSIWALDQKGTLAQTMMYGPPNMGSCDCSFRNESLDTIVKHINELTFLTSIGMIQNETFFGKQASLNENATVFGVGENSTASFRQLQGTNQITDVIHYKTNYWYMAFGVVSTLICVMFVIPVYWRYGEVGRDVTLGPIEIANAFRAPMLTDGGAKQTEARDIDELIHKLGDKKVQYGYVDIGHAQGPAGIRQSVAIDEPARVRPVSGMWSSPTSPTMTKSPRFN